eukprot:5228457-Pleurochrysis_carterae.AAC.1
MACPSIKCTVHCLMVCSHTSQQSCLSFLVILIRLLLALACVSGYPLPFPDLHAINPISDGIPSFLCFSCVFMSTPNVFFSLRASLRCAKFALDPHP